MPDSREAILRYFRLLLRTFFHRIEITDTANVPAERGCLALSWHPNGIIDGGVMLAYFPRPIVVGARHGLFRWPLLGWTLRQLGAIPIYRRRDADPGSSTADRQSANRQAIDALAQAIANGGCSALFPEGTSHDDPHLLELKTGAAHLFYRAVELTPAGVAPPVIIPVGLHYSHKTLFGSDLLVAFHAPVEIPEELRNPSPDEPSRRAQAKALTRLFDQVLSEVVMATESWQLHHSMYSASKLIRAEGAVRARSRSRAPGVVERVKHFGSIWKRYQAAIVRFPKETRQLLVSVQRYDRLLQALRIESHQLDGATWIASPRRAIWLALEFLLVFLVLPPFLLIGVLVNLIPAIVVWSFNRLIARHYKDEATLKILIGSFVFPLTWLLAAWLVVWGEGLIADTYPHITHRPFLTGIVAFLLSAFGGVLALQYRQIATQTWRTLRVYVTRAGRKKSIQTLLEIRSRIYDDFLELDARLSAASVDDTRQGESVLRAVD